MRRPRARSVLALVAGTLVLAVLAVVGCSSEPSPTVAQRPATEPLRCATPSHPNPVVLVPGTFDATSWSAIADALSARGYCVYTFQYNDGGVGSIARSARQLDS